MVRTISATDVKELFSRLPTLETPRLLLRQMSLEDAGDMYEYASNPEVSRYTVWDYHRSLEDTVAYLRCVLRNYSDGALENWGIVHKENGKLIGTCGYFSWDTDHARGEIHYALSRDYSRRGLMSEAVGRIIRFGFEVMHLNRVEAKCMLANAGSERVMQKAGMSFEGIMREGVYAKHGFHDLKMYALLRRDWRAGIGG